MGTNKGTDIFWESQLIELHTQEDVFSSQINKIEQDRLHIQHPIDRHNRLMKVNKEMPITVFFYDDQRGLSKFDTQMIDYPHQLALKKPSTDSIEKVFKRNFFRVPANVKVYLDRNIRAQVEPALVFTQDISGGGFAFLYPEPLEKGITLTGNIHLKTDKLEEYVEFKAKVVANNKNNSKAFLNAVEFVEMSEAVRSSIIKFCIHRQIEIRNKMKDY